MNETVVSTQVKGALFSDRFTVESADAYIKHHFDAQAKIWTISVLASLEASHPTRSFIPTRPSKSAQFAMLITQPNSENCAPPTNHVDIGITVVPNSNSESMTPTTNDLAMCTKCLTRTPIDQALQAHFGLIYIDPLMQLQRVVALAVQTDQSLLLASSLNRQV